MQCKDIQERPILEFLAALNGRMANWFGDGYDNSVTMAMPSGTPPKLALAKMKKMIKRGTVEGCPCGCRGDFMLTDRGRAALL